MNCNEASELLAAAVLGDLDRDRQRAVHTHLAGCDRCLEEEGELFESMHLLRAHAVEEPGVDIHDSVMTRVSSYHQPLRQVNWMTRTLLTAAATALIVVGLQTVLETRGSVSSPLPSGSGSVRDAALSFQPERPAPSLLDGTLFDPRRNTPDERRQWKELRRRDERIRS